MPLQIYHYVPQGVDVQNLIKIDSAVAALRMREKNAVSHGFFFVYISVYQILHSVLQLHFSFGCKV